MKENSIQIDHIDIIINGFNHNQIFDFNNDVRSIERPNKREDMK